MNIYKCFLFLIFIGLSNLSTKAQIQKIFYVDDVEMMEIVTVNFCVNDSAKIDKVSILPEKTSYKNQIVIGRLKAYLMSVQYYPDSQLRNNCYDSTFQFINIKYENNILDKADIQKCEKFRTGSYRYKNILYADTKVKRRNRIQTEKGDNFNERYRVTWTASCKYELKYLKVNDKKNKHLLGESIVVDIIGINGNQYLFTAHLLDQPDSIGVLKLISK